MRVPPKAITKVEVDPSLHALVLASFASRFFWSWTGSSPPLIPLSKSLRSQLALLATFPKNPRMPIYPPIAVTDNAAARIDAISCFLTAMLSESSLSATAFRNDRSAFGIPGAGSESGAGRDGADSSATPRHATAISRKNAIFTDITMLFLEYGKGSSLVKN